MDADADELEDPNTISTIAYARTKAQPFPDGPPREHPVTATAVQHHRVYPPPGMIRPDPVYMNSGFLQPLAIPRPPDSSRSKPPPRPPRSPYILDEAALAHTRDQNRPLSGFLTEMIQNDLALVERPTQTYQASLTEYVPPVRIRPYIDDHSTLPSSRWDLLQSMAMSSGNEDKTHSDRQSHFTASTNFEGNTLIDQAHMSRNPGWRRTSSIYSGDAGNEEPNSHNFQSPGLALPIPHTLQDQFTRSRAQSAVFDVTMKDEHRRAAEVFERHYHNRGNDLDTVISRQHPMTGITSSGANEAVTDDRDGHTRAEGESSGTTAQGSSNGESSTQPQPSIWVRLKGTWTDLKG